MSQLVTVPVISAFQRLKSPELEPVLAYLSQLRTNTLEVLAGAGDIDLVRRMQGRAQLLEELLKLARDADELAAKIRK